MDMDKKMEGIIQNLLSWKLRCLQKKQWLEDYIPFWNDSFWGDMLVFIQMETHEALVDHCFDLDQKWKNAMETKICFWKSGTFLRLVFRFDNTLFFFQELYVVALDDQMTRSSTCSTFVIRAWS